ncbi:arabinose transporter [Pelistega indica]|uniref:Arabinose transporter n=1 Tax=Pelistega indica TaxID=1414851 RepID=V8GAB5_9BURK|nr:MULTISPECIES: sugar transporter [Pelistega]ETD72632.1 arabinose transporter [Pelistega indica]
MISPVNPSSPNNQSWFVVALFAFAAFIFNTTEFVPIGLLPSIAQSLNVPESQTGLLMTIYAWSVTILSIPLTLAVGTVERKKLLISLFIIFIIAHIFSAVAWSYNILTLSRLLIACAHAIFWSISIPLAMRLAPEGNRAKALAFIVTGSSLATILGVPLGTAIGQHFGWRITFYSIASIAVLVMLLLIKYLPKAPSQNAGDLKSLPKLLKRATLMQAFLLTALTITGYFAAYTYITPYLREVGRFDEQFVIIILFTMGVAGIFGSILFTKLIRKTAIHTYTMGAGLLLICLLCLEYAQSHAWTMLLVALGWGIAITLIAMSLQTKVLEVAADAADLATAIYSGTFNIGIGGGAFVGSLVLDHLGVLHTAHVGAVFVFTALVFFLMVTRHIWVLKNNN